jgi:lactate permease
LMQSTVDPAGLWVHPIGLGALPSLLWSLSAALPIILLLGGLVVLNWPARRASIVAFAVAVGLSVALFGMTGHGLLVALGKGIALSLFVLLVIWSALLLFTVVDDLGAIKVIGAAMVNAAGRAPAQALMIGWGFSGFLQGIAGFGAPVASVVPLLKMARFDGERAVAGAMIGHSWAITFGSMGSSYLAILLVTRLPAEPVAVWTALLFALPIIATGLSVLHLLLGRSGVREGWHVAAAAGGVMAIAMVGIASIGAAPIASTVPALFGCGVIWLFSRRPMGQSGEGGAIAGFHLAFLPYYVLIGLTIATQLGPLAPAARGISLGIDFPATTTNLGYQVAAEANYPRFRVLAHPATVIALAIVVMVAVYRALGRWPVGTLRRALRLTYRRSVPSSVAVTFMVMMALVMSDSGMTRTLADAIRTAAGPAFPVLSPFLGVLGAFMTGSNTSSNVTMGLLQLETALALGLPPVLIAGAQTVGGSIGAGVSPDKAVIGAAVAGTTGREAAIARRALPYALLTTGIVGCEVLALAIVGAAR